MLQRGLSQFYQLIAVSLLVVSLPIGNSFGLIRSQQSKDNKGGPCLKHNARHTHDRPVRLVSSALMDRVIDKRPVERPGQLGKNNLRGVVKIEVLIDKHGKVVCARGVEGHPIAMAATVLSVREWTFKPYSVGHKRKAVVGVLTVPYDFGS
jgi:hypothetical protein